jgi:hypothetical protein
LYFDTHLQDQRRTRPELAGDNSFEKNVKKKKEKRKKKQRKRERTSKNKHKQRKAKCRDADVGRRAAENAAQLCRRELHQKKVEILVPQVVHQLCALLRLSTKLFSLRAGRCSKRTKKYVFHSVFTRCSFSLFF